MNPKLCNFFLHIFICRKKDTMIKLKNLLAENMLESKRRALREQTVDPALWGVPGCTATNALEFSNWYTNTYLSPTTGYVGNTMIVTKLDGQLNGPEEIVDRFVVTACFTKAYNQQLSGIEKGVLFFTQKTPTKNFDLTTNTMKVNGTQMNGPGDAYYDANDLVKANISLTTVGPNDLSLNNPRGLNAMSEIANPKAGNIIFNPSLSGAKTYRIQSDHGVYLGATLIGYFPFGSPWELVPVKMDGHGFAMAPGGVEIPIMDAAWFAANFDEKGRPLKKK